MLDRAVKIRADLPSSIRGSSALCQEPIELLDLTHEMLRLEKFNRAGFELSWKHADKLPRGATTFSRCANLLPPELRV